MKKLKNWVSSLGEWNLKNYKDKQKLRDIFKEISQKVSIELIYTKYLEGLKLF